MNIAAVLEIEDELIPSLTKLRDALAAKATEFDKILKIGRYVLLDPTYTVHTQLMCSTVLTSWTRRLYRWARNSLATSNS